MVPVAVGIVDHALPLDRVLGDFEVNYDVSGDLVRSGRDDSELIKAKHRPLVFITSNNEKELPDAFLRRCFFHFIKFPEADTMRQIVNVHFPTLKSELLGVAMKTFYDVRNLPGLKKKPSTSELLDWLKLLVAEDIPLTALQSADNKVSVPPLVGALLKNEQDVSLFEKLVFMNQRNR